MASSQYLSLFGRAYSLFKEGLETPRLRLKLPNGHGIRFVTGSGAPSGSYDLREDSSAVYFRYDATSIATALYFTNDKGTTWLNFQALTSSDSPTFAGLTVTNYLTAASSAVAITKLLTTTNGISSGAALKVGGRRYTMTAASSALTNSTAETSLASTTLEASAFANAGDTLHFRARLKVTANNSTTTLTTRVHLTATSLVGTPILTIGPTDTDANHIIVIEGTLTARGAAGASSNIVGNGFYNVPAVQGTAASLPFAVDATSRATNAALILQVSGQWSAADANSVQCEEFAVWGPY